MTKILAIGNSFSQDATAYFNQIAAAAGADAKAVNLYIPGCSLARHCENADSDKPAYEMQLDGLPTGRHVSIRQMLYEEQWDIITLQQVSQDSGIYATWQPYLDRLDRYIRRFRPNAARFIHQTWAYEIDSTHPGFKNYGCDRQAMYRQIVGACNEAANRIGASILPVGEAIRQLRQTPEFDYPNAAPSLCRDGFHLSLDYGRYAAAAVWCETLLGIDIRNNSFLPPDFDIASDDGKLAVVKQTVHNVRSR